MLVCHVTIRPAGRLVPAEIAEIGAAADLSDTGNVVFATFVDDPASGSDIIDAYLGQIMLEVASADAVADAGFSASLAINETATAADIPNGTVVAAGGATTWNPSDIAQATLSNGNLTVTTSGVNTGVRATTGFTTGKYYWEATAVTWAGNGSEVGVATASAALLGGALAGQAVVTRGTTALGGIHVNGTYSGSSLGTMSNGTVVGIAVDLTAGLIWFRKAPSGNWNGSGTANPATGTGGISLGVLSGNVLLPIYGGGIANEVTTANFGATTFTGAVPSGFTSGWV
jgi:hypothetical protein